MKHWSVISRFVMRSGAKVRMSCPIAIFPVNAIVVHGKPGELKGLQIPVDRPLAALEPVRQLFYRPPVREDRRICMIRHGRST